MQSEPNGSGPQANRVSGERQNLYALVIYLPQPIGAFLDDLRRELVPGCNPHAHVSVLPPRPLPVAPEAAIEEARAIVAAFAPFEIELGGIEKFDFTDVIYISVERGGDELRQIHARLNQGALAFPEPFTYHPHVTVAQDIPDGEVEALVDLAAQRWQEFRGPRRFRAEATVFVRNTGGNLWVDLASGPMRGAPAGPVG